MATPTVFQDYTGSTVIPRSARLRVVAAVDHFAHAYVTGTGRVVGDYGFALPTADGRITFADVAPNSGSSADVITAPEGTVYEWVSVYENADPVVEYFTAPDDDLSHWIGNSLTDVPGSLPDSAVTALAAEVAAMSTSLSTVSATATSAASSAATAQSTATSAASAASTAQTTASSAASAATAAQTTASAAIPLVQKAAASGVASLDGSTKVPIAQVPTGVTSSTVALGDAPATAQAAAISTAATDATTKANAVDAVAEHTANKAVAGGYPSLPSSFTLDRAVVPNRAFGRRPNRRYVAKLYSIDTTPVVGLFLGDSMEQAYTLDPFNEPAPAQLEAMVCERFNTRARNQGQFYSNYPAVSVYPAGPQTTNTGGTARLSGLNNHDLELTGAGHKTSATDTGSKARIYYTKARSGGGVFQPYVDGVSTGSSVNTTDGTVPSSPGFASGYYIDVDLTTNASHVVEARWVSGAARVSGTRIFNGNDASGFHMVRMGLGGYTLTEFATDLICQSAITNLAPHKIVLQLGHNDVATGVTLPLSGGSGPQLSATAFGTLLGSVLSTLTTLAPNASLEYWFQPRTNVLPSTWGTTYRAAARAACVAYDVEFVDTYDLIGDYTSSVDPESIGTFDHIHYDKRGHKMVAHAVAAGWVPPAGRTPSLSNLLAPTAAVDFNGQRATTIGMPLSVGDTTGAAKVEVISGSPVLSLYGTGATRSVSLGQFGNAGIVALGNGTAIDFSLSWSATNKATISTGIITGSGVAAAATDLMSQAAVDARIGVPDNSTVQVSSSVLSVKALGVGTSQLAANAVTLAKLATQADQTILGNTAGSTAVPTAMTAAQSRTLLKLGEKFDAGVGVVNTLAETTVLASTTSLQIPANVIVAGDAYRLVFWVKMGQFGSASTFRWRPKIGTTALLDFTTASFSSGATAEYGKIVCDLVFTTAGASGKVQAVTEFVYQAAAGASAAATPQVNFLEDQSVDTTAAINFNLTVTNGTAGAAIGGTCKGAVLKQMGAV